MTEALVEEKRLRIKINRLARGRVLTFDAHYCSPRVHDEQAHVTILRSGLEGMNGPLYDYFISRDGREIHSYLYKEELLRKFLGPSFRGAKEGCNPKKIKSQKSIT